MSTARIHTDPVAPIAATLDFQGHTIRLLLIDGKIMFVANDVATALEYAKPAVSIRDSVPPSERRRVRISKGHGCQRPTALSVLGLRALLGKSTKSATPAFKVWLAEQQIDGLHAEMTEAVAVPAAVRLFATTTRKPQLPPTECRAVTSPVAHLLFSDVEIGVVLVEGVAWLVAQDVCKALGYRDPAAATHLRNNHVAPKHILKARLSDAKGRARSLLVHPDAMPDWMARAQTTQCAGPRKVLALAFMAFLKTSGCTRLSSIETAHADLIAA